MVTERRGEYPHRDIREGGVAARFRPLAGVGDVLTGDPVACPPSSGAPPAFASAPWGYKRAEVDSWASWVAALLAHGRKETVRADSAEATLKATLERLEQLQDRSSDGEQAVAPERPGVGALPRRVAPTPVAPTPAAQPPADPPPTDQPADPPAPSTGDAADRERPELARLQVVERTLHEVMALLHRLAGPEEATGQTRK